MYKIKNKSFVFIVLIIAMSIMLNGCAKGVPENVAAVVNKENIGMEEFDKEYNIQVNAIQGQLGEGILEQEGPNGKLFKDELKDDTLNRLILEEIITQDAKKNDIKVTDEEIDEILEEIKEGMGGEEELNKYLESVGMDEEYLKEYNKKTILLQKHKQDFIDGFELKDKEAEEFFEENKEDLTVVKARHILVETEEKGKEILAKLEDGEDFQKLAMENSQDSQTAQMGGELGYFPKGHNPAEFDNVVFGLKEGETSSLFKSEIGFHIVEVQEKKDTFEALKPELIGHMKENKYVDYVEKLQQNAKIETFLEEEKNEDKAEKENKEEDKKDKEDKTKDKK